MKKTRALRTVSEAQDNGFIQGICLAIADKLRGYSIQETWKSAGLTIEICEKAGVDEYDLDVIKQHIKSLE